MADDLNYDGASSPLTSIGSFSPSPPPNFSSFAFTHSYPSPSSSQRSSAKASPAPDAMVSTPPSSAEDGSPLRKKRKLADPKPRTTERLDLRLGEVDPSEQPQVERLLKVLHKKRKIVVIAGAGISVSAGIPDFRSSAGLFKSLRKQHNLKSSGKDLFDASVYQDGSSTSTFHDMVRSLSHSTKSAEPTAFHHLLATLAHEGRLLRLYSQNVDGIDTSLEPLKTVVPLPKKAPWPKTIQLHGGLDKMVCCNCHTLSDFQAELFDGPVPPSCAVCEDRDVARQMAEKRGRGIGRLRPRMVLYNEHNPDDEAIGSVARTDLRTRPDAVIVAGTTLKVPGVRRIVREMCGVVRDRRDGVTVWINNDPEPMGKDLENSWDLVVRGPCDEVARLAAMRRWDDTSEFIEVTDEELQRAKHASKAEVVVLSPKKIKAVEQVQGQLVTPAASPRMTSLQPDSQPTRLDVTTPTKKRKSGSTEKPKAAKPTKSAPAKGAKKGKKGEKTAKITTAFPVSKATNKATDKTKSSLNDNIQVSPGPTKGKASQNTKDALIRAASIPMAPLSPQEVRNNTSPPYSPLQTFHHPNAECLTTNKPTSPNERKSGTISPGPLRGDLALIVDS